MPSYCTKCGKLLQDGEICSCTSGNLQQQQPQMQPQMQSQQPQMQPQMQQVKQESEFSKDFKLLVPGVFKNPIKGGKAFIQKSNIGISLIFIAIQALLSGFFAMIAVSKLVNMIYGAFSSALTSGLGAWSSLFTQRSSVTIDIPYASTFFGTFGLSALFSVILAGLLFLGFKIIKINVEFKNMIAMVAVRSMIISCITVVAMFFALINPLIGLFIFGFGNIAGVVVICFTVPDGFASAKMFYILLLVIFVFTAIMFFILYKSSGIYVPSFSTTKNTSNISDLLKDLY